MSAYRKASVYVRDRFAGFLSETDSGYRFAYDAEYLTLPDAQAISLTLPLREAPYESNVLFPFFDGLIPEGWLLHIVSKNWKLDQNDRFGLLLVACKDCIGAVRIEEAEQ
ncbi:MAG: HipA N-terminal domain-containing protein [Clostridia bacterium]|jgi:serine/threonine-protein kinase HipA|nr:HipA N-terminal domain-containing protein [Clostridia bacterium]